MVDKSKDRCYNEYRVKEVNKIKKEKEIQKNEETEQRNQNPETVQSD